MMNIYDQEHELELLLKETREESKEEGRQEGRQEGREEGREEGVEAIILSMLKKNLDYVEVAELTSLPVSKVQDLKEKFLREGLLAV